MLEQTLSSIIVRRIKNKNEPVFQESWRHLFEEAFPPYERDPWEEIEGYLDEPDTNYLLAAFDSFDNFLGLACIELMDNVAALWYLAVDPNHRNRGVTDPERSVGQTLYREARRIAQAAGCRMISIEVEVPDLAAPEYQDLARRRMYNFYGGRLGCEWAKNIVYFQKVAHHDPIRMNLLVDRIDPALDETSTLALLKKSVGEGSEPVDTLMLERLNPVT